MRRRRQRNPLLVRILLISIGVHIIALPILAHYGAFDKLKHEFADSKVVLVNLTPVEQDKPKESAKPKKTAAKTQNQKKGPAAPKAGSGPKSNLNLPKIVTTGPSTGDADGTTPAVDSGTGTAGQVPTAKNDGTKPGGDEGTKPVDANPTKPADPTKTEKTPEPPVKPPIVPVKHVPVYADVEPSYQPQPVIPDELRADALDKTVVVEFTISPDGKPASVEIAQSSGIRELDDAALKAARLWKFKPATLDGQPTDSKLRLRIQFKVD